MINESVLRQAYLLRTWIESHVSDPIKYITYERQIYAFYLLEKLIQAGVMFIFKGGTALILLLDEAKRFSTDIDILITRPNMESLEKGFDDFVGHDSIFVKWEHDFRSDSTFPKEHYKFYFSSEYKNEDQEGYIVLDAVFEDNPYIKLVKKEIRNDVLPTTEPYDMVLIPSIPNIMIDKLTAFAPNTIGVKYERLTEGGIIKDRSREVVKQWFDVNELYQKCDDFHSLSTLYGRLSIFEIEQRDLHIEYTTCLSDTLQTVLCYLSQGQYGRQTTDYENIRRGVRKLNSFVNVELSNGFFITAAVNISELISKVLCDEEHEYIKICEKSKKMYPYEDFIKLHQLKKVVNIVKANNSNDRDRFILALRVINEYFTFDTANANITK